MGSNNSKLLPRYKMYNHWNYEHVRPSNQLPFWVPPVLSKRFAISSTLLLWIPGPICDIVMSYLGTCIDGSRGLKTIDIENGMPHLFIQVVGRDLVCADGKLATY